MPNETHRAPLRYNISDLFSSLLGSAIDLRDGPTAGHSRRVLLYSVKIAEAIGGMEDQLKTLGMGAWLHDIGKLAIPDGILLKPGALKEQEREIMQRHVALGYDLVKGIPFLADAAEIILAHHEQALQTARQHPGPIHLLLTDVVMPGMNGRVL